MRDVIGCRDVTIINQQYDMGVSEIGFIQPK
jgi:hypothetical protein